MLKLGRIRIDNPSVMGVLNVTPDSFSDGGLYASRERAVRRAVEMADQGAAIVDIGGESTRPGASSVDTAEELERVVPVVEALVREVDLPISVDTSKAQVMREAIAAGASLINDVYALRADGALDAAIDLKCPVCLMHMQGEPRTMQAAPDYDDVVGEVLQFLQERVAQCRQAGMADGMLIVDPGFGFGKTPTHNLELLAQLDRLHDLGVPVMIGVSRKSTLGMITGRDVTTRLAASLSAAVLAVMSGASIVRAHDVAETVDALSVAKAVMEAGGRE